MRPPSEPSSRSSVLDTRVLRILRWLLDQEGVKSTASLGADLGLSQRVIRYRLDAVASFLASEGLTLVRQRGAGLVIDGPDETKTRLRRELGELSSAPRVYARDERERILILSLLSEAPSAVSLEELGEALEVSKASARRDLKRAEEWLEMRGLLLARRPGVGVAVVGSESKIRQATVQLLVEAVPHDVLLELSDVPIEESTLAQVKVPAGMRERLNELGMHRTSALLTERIFDGALAERFSETVLSLYLAVTAQRLKSGHVITMEPGRHRSLHDHPVSLTANDLARSFAQSFDLTVPDEEIAGITEYLLGLAAVNDDVDTTEFNHDNRLLDELIALAAERLHESLVEDAELRRSLAQHLERLAVRLRYGLPVHNPLLAEVRSRYPDVHAVARQLGDVMAEHFDAGIAEDEVGYLTMYLCGSMERTQLRPRRRAIVICPSGMATAWVLVSRIQSEFPQLELAKVMSARSFSTFDTADADIVISTVAIDHPTIPVIVVNALLTPEDVRRVSDHV